MSPIGTGLGDRGALRLEIDGGVPIGGLDAGVAEPVADRHEVDAGLQKMNGGGVAERHGGGPACGERRCHGRAPARRTCAGGSGRRIGSVARHDGCERAAGVELGIDPTLGEQRAENLGRLWPERTEALLAAFAAEPHLERANELEVDGPQVEDLLHARAGVEEREQERVIAAAIRASAVGGVEKRRAISSASRYSTMRCVRA